MDRTLIGYLTDTERAEFNVLLGRDRTVFQRRYLNDPVAFTRDCIEWRDGVGLTRYQEEILEAIPQYHRVTVRGPHGLGKTCVAAIAGLWFALTRDGGDWKAPVTASVWRQLTKFYFPELYKWARQLKWDKIAWRDPFIDRSERLTLSLKLDTGELFAVASDRAEAIEGAHADSLLYVFDEAKAIPPETFDAAEGALSVGNCVPGSTVVAGIAPELVTKRWYKGEIVEIETVLGHHVSVTPDHPVLTNSGWVLAGRLDIGQEVVCCSDAQALVMTIVPDTVQKPTRIEEIFESLSIEDRAGLGIPYVLSPKYLNGHILDGEVNIEAPNRLLHNWHTSVLNESFVDGSFMYTANDAICLSRQRSTRELHLGFGSPAVVSTASGRSIESFRGMHSDVDRLCMMDIPPIDAPFVQAVVDGTTRNAIRSGKVPYRLPIEVGGDKGVAIRRFPAWMSTPHTAAGDAINAQVAPDTTARDSELFAKFNRVLPGKVFCDQILHLHRRQFEGHVYNLQTGCHWFVGSDYSTDRYSTQEVDGIILHNCYALAISTPGEPAGRFYDIHARKPGYEDWWVRHVTLAEAIGAGRVSREWAEARRRQWGETSAVYQNRVLGEFAASEADGVIPLAWIEAANERWRAWDDAGRHTEELTAIGVDVARSGEDRTVMALLYDGTIIAELRRTSREGTMETTGRVEGILSAHGGRAVVDVIGVGAGVVDRLRELGRDVVAFNAAEGTDRRDRSGELGFSNERAAAWWTLRELLDPDGGVALALPPDDLLTGDLTAPRWRVVSGGRIQIESKDDIRKRLGRSTDDGDAVVMALYQSSMWHGIYV